MHVTDTTAPQIKLSGDDFMSVKKGDKYSDPGYTATDNCDGDITDSVKVSGDKVDKDKAGKYTVTYEVSDSSGNKATATRVVSVYDPAATADTVNPGNKIIYLTFDDGPGKVYTGAIRCA